MRPPGGPPAFPGFTLPLEGDDEGLEKLKRKIESDRGFNCQFYKEKCLRRRIAVRMRARGQMSFADYSALLDREPAEYDHLLDTLTINVTKFFRNLETWNALEQHVLPELFAGRAPVKVWSAGSASGEEAYTCSMLFRDWLARNGRAHEAGRIQITGTDIDRRSLEAARRGEYPELSMAETPPDAQARWFTGGPPWAVKPEVKQGVAFEHRDLISGEPLAGQNLIFCRNVVIYFDREIQERLFRRFHDALAPGGYLVMGKVETLIGEARLLFRPVNNRERIFRRPPE
ncbi:MAG TPA: protein-glutamate O-methyltransferase CheR [Longimicrobium sp.]|jgi:chemotaxis methyl-accepting protein methylase|uniref:CheR family methyltransferase n=1 Tax=Longimicrobium sp. TaxID=2029185 RepID=UPI002EDB48EA